MQVTMKPLGDSALMVHLGEGMDPSIHAKVKNLSALLQAQPFEGFIETVPAYNNITIHYNPYTVRLAQFGEEGLTSFQKVSAYMDSLIQQVGGEQSFEDRTITIPVYYGDEFGPDLAYVAESNGLSIEEVIRIHSENEYLVYMIGFAPGFPFMGGMNEAIATPRRETPRLSIPSGSVGIAGKQTGVYPMETPGGWQIIGRTPKKLFLPDLSPPSLLRSGDKIKFVPITIEEYQNMEEAME
ncbi:5-oxoprolinase subunit PxpB [Sporosarcina soli]|uniref:5-oxoprolinase subunit PxpB n=1 Tax=Sporosarcina soli TaxID=334736 RepID=A0ABW0TS11_9BACL